MRWFIPLGCLFIANSAYALYRGNAEGVFLAAHIFNVLWWPILIGHLAKVRK